MNAFCTFEGHDFGEAGAEYYGLNVCVPPGAQKFYLTTWCYLEMQHLRGNSGSMRSGAHTLLLFHVRPRQDSSHLQLRKGALTRDQLS